MYFLSISEAIRTRLIATCPETYHARKSRYPSADLLLGTENSPRAVNYNTDYSLFSVAEHMASTDFTDFELKIAAINTDFSKLNLSFS